MKHLGVLTAGGDTPALNATLAGVVRRANELEIAVTGIMDGFGGMIDPRVPHVRLNPLFQTIPELQPHRGGTILGSSRTYIGETNVELCRAAAGRLARLEANGRAGLDGLICIGGDGTINGMQPLSEFLPCVLAPKTIDNDLGLNYPGEPNDWLRQDPRRRRRRRDRRPDLRQAVRPGEREPAVDGERRHARLRDRRAGRRPGDPAHPHHRREPPPDRRGRGDGPRQRVHRPGQRVRPART